MIDSALDGRDGFTDFNRLNSRLSGLDERGLVLSLSAFAEDSLGELLRVYMRDHAAISDLLYGFNAPLGTFSSRIKSAVALGLITPEQFFDLEILRKIMNKFSHTWEEISFEDQSIKNLIKNLSYSRIDDKYPTSLFDKLKLSLESILIEIRVAINNIEKNALKEKIIGRHLFIGLSGRNENDKIASARERFKFLKQNFLSAGEKEQEFLLMIRQRLIHRIGHAVGGASIEGRAELDQLVTKLASEDWLEPD